MDSSIEGINCGGVHVSGVIGIAEERWAKVLDIGVDDVGALLEGLRDVETTCKAPRDPYRQARSSIAAPVLTTEPFSGQLSGDQSATLAHVLSIPETVKTPRPPVQITITQPMFPSNVPMRPAEPQSLPCSRIKRVIPKEGRPRAVKELMQRCWKGRAEVGNMRDGSVARKVKAGLDAKHMGKLVELEGEIEARHRMAAASRVHSASYDESVSHVKYKRWATSCVLSLSAAILLRKKTVVKTQEDTYIAFRTYLNVCRVCARMLPPDARMQARVVQALTSHAIVGDFFSSWPSYWMDELAKHAHRVEHANGTEVTSPGTWVAACHIVITGKVRREVAIGSAAADAAMFPILYDGEAKQNTLLHAEALWLLNRARHTFKAIGSVITYAIPLLEYQSVSRAISAGRLGHTEQAAHHSATSNTMKGAVALSYLKYALPLVPADVTSSLLFSELTNDAAQQLIDKAEPIILEAGQIIVSQGDTEGTSVYLIMEGGATVLRSGLYPGTSGCLYRDAITETPPDLTRLSFRWEKPKKGAGVHSGSVLHRAIRFPADFEFGAKRSVFDARICGHLGQGSVIGVAALLQTEQEETVESDRPTYLWRLRVAGSTAMGQLNEEKVSAVHQRSKEDILAGLILTPEYSIDHLVDSIPVFERLRIPYVERCIQEAGRSEEKVEKLLCPTLKDHACLMLSLKPFFNDLLRCFSFVLMKRGHIVRNVVPKLFGWCTRGVLTVAHAGKPFATTFTKSLFIKEAFGPERLRGDRYCVKAQTGSLVWAIHVVDLTRILIRHIPTLPLLEHIVLNVSAREIKQRTACRKNDIREQLVQHGDVPVWFKLSCADLAKENAVRALPGRVPAYSEYVLDSHTVNSFMSIELQPGHPLLAVGNAETEITLVRHSLDWIRFHNDDASAVRRVKLHRRLAQLRRFVAKMRILGMSRLMNPKSDDERRVKRLLDELNGTPPIEEQPKKLPEAPAKLPQRRPQQPKNKAKTERTQEVHRPLRASTNEGTPLPMRERMLPLVVLERRRRKMEMQEDRDARTAAFLKDVLSGVQEAKQRGASIDEAVASAGYDPRTSLFTSMQEEWAATDQRTGLNDYLMPQTPQAERVYYTRDTKAPERLLPSEDSWSEVESISQSDTS